MNSYYEKFADGTVRCIDDEIPFDIPNGWAWTRLNELALYRKGPFGSSLTKSMFIPKSKDSVKVYEQKNAILKDWRLGEYYISKEKYSSMSSFAVYPNDIIVSCAGTIGETYLLPEDAIFGIINQALMKVSLFDLSMAKYWQLIFEYILIVDSKMKGAGSAIKNIPPFEVLKAFLVPIPPINEQRKIIDRFENIMSHNKRYQTLVQQLDKLNKDIKNLLNRSILQEAIQGRLVPQIESEGTAEELLEDIRAEKKRLVKEGKLKKSALANESCIFRGEDNKYYEQIGSQILDISELIPFDLPISWVWVRGKTIFMPMESTKPIGAFTYIDIEAVNNSLNVIDRPKQIELEKAPSRATRKLHRNDILFSMVRPYLRNIALVTKQFENAIASTGFYVITPSKGLNPNYLFYLMLSNYVIDGLNTFMKGENSPSINNCHIENFLFPLPPIKEQQRIVERLEKILNVI